MSKLKGGIFTKIPLGGLKVPLSQPAPNKALTKGIPPGKKKFPRRNPPKSQLLTTVFWENSPKVAPYLAVPPTIVRVLALSQT